MKEDLLIIFIKNPIRGKVKTRLAADLGDDTALRVYRQLIKKTIQAIEPVKTDKWILYSDYLDQPDDSPDNHITTGVQEGDDLGERMLTAFRRGFNSGYQHLCIIGSDCYDIRPEILQEAFDKLREYGFVLGPSNDGGYYLLGMNALLDEIFQNKNWSTSSVLEQTIGDIKKNKYSYYLLEELVDIDTKSDIDLLNIDLKKFLSS